MEEIPINQDIRKYKVKDIGVFSLKEACWIAVGAVCAYGTFILQKNFFETTEITYFVSLLAAVPAILFGFIKPYGVSFFTYLRVIMKENVLSPKYLPYESSVKYVLKDFVDEEEAEKIWFNWNCTHKKIKKSRRKRIYV